MQLHYCREMSASLYLLASVCVYFLCSCVSGCASSSASVFLENFSRLPPYLKLILLVFGALVKGPVISEPPDVIELVEAFDVVRHSVSLQHVLALWDGGYGVDLQVWKQQKLRKERGRVTRDGTADENRQEFFSDLKEHGKSQIHSHRTRTHTGRLVK